MLRTKNDIIRMTDPNACPNNPNSYMGATPAEMVSIGNDNAITNNTPLSVAGKVSKGYLRSDKAGR